MNRGILYGKQSLDAEDFAAVEAVLRSDFLTCGPEVEAFEREFAQAVGAAHAVAVCNATAALHLAMRVLGIGPGDRVVTSPLTFLASANCAAFVGATPDFCDVDPLTGNLCPSALHKNWKPDTRAVVVVDLGGRPANLPAIAEVARANGAWVIEDACHAVGGRFTAEGREWLTGGHPWADLTTFSFHPVKTMTTGEGGMLCARRQEWADAARCLRSHGVERNPEKFEGLGLKTSWDEKGPWVYEMHDLGYNYRLTDIQCALGRSQLKKLPKFIARRQEIAKRYLEAFAGMEGLKPLALHKTISGTQSFGYDLSQLSLHLFQVAVDFEALGMSRAEVQRQLSARGVGSQVHYIPVYLQPWYRRTFGFQPGLCPEAEKFYRATLSLPLHPSMTSEDVETVIEAVRELGR